MTLIRDAMSSSMWLALAAGAVQLIGVVFLGVFFAVGEPFGTLNDICIALAAILTAVLAWRLLAAQAAPAPALTWLAVGSAGLGALIVVVGSALVIFNMTGWVLAALVTEF